LARKCPRGVADDVYASTEYKAPLETGAKWPFVILFDRRAMLLLRVLLLLLASTASLFKHPGFWRDLCFWYAL
jgi:hypothetical protein